MRDYSAYPSVFEWRTVEDALGAETLREGVHSIGGAEGAPLDLLISGDALDPSRTDAIAVFFSGALSNRVDTAGPYFSGKRMAARLGIPYVAVSDPTLYLSDDLTLGWYTGPRGAQRQLQLATLLRGLADRAGRDALLIGGSGGGFASLVTAGLAGLSALVWNPQTDILQYEPTAVTRYMEVIAPDVAAAPEAAKRLAATSGGLITRVMDTELPRRLLYLQNATDWHVRKHTAAFIDHFDMLHRGRGYYSQGRAVGLELGNFGVGHAVPPQELLDEAIRQMLDPSASAWDAHVALAAEGHVGGADAKSLPRDLRELDAASAPALEVSVESSRATVSLQWGGVNPGSGARWQFHAFAQGRRVSFSPLLTEGSHTFDGAEDIDEIQGVVWDGFGHALARLRHGLPAVARVLVYGSCVSRDAFTLPAAPVLAGYVARSSLAVSLSATPSAWAEADLSANPSPFQRRMVEMDLSRSLASRLEQDDYDVVLVDFVDERFDLIRDPSGQLVTYSPEFQRTGLDPSPSVAVRSGSEEHLAAFRAGWERLVSLVGGDRIIVNRVRWASVDEDGEDIADSAAVAAGNATLEALYRIVEPTPGLRWLRHDESLFLGATEHRWGRSPFHYVEEFYDRLLAQLASLTVAGPDGAQQTPVEPLAARVPFIPYDFGVALPRRGAGSLDIQLAAQGDRWISIPDTGEVDWRETFVSNARANRMWLASLDFVGRMVSRGKKDGDREMLRLAGRIALDLCDFVSTPEGRTHIDELPSSGDHAAATRIKALVKLLMASDEFDLLSEDEARRLLGEVEHTAGWLEDERHFHRNNHGVMASIALMLAGRTLTGERGEQLFRLGQSRILLIARDHFDADGLCYENTIGYHNFNLGLYRYALRFIEECGAEASGELREIIARAGSALAVCVRQDSSVPPVGDSPAYVLQVASENRSKAFLESGFAVVKNDDLYLSLICGAPTEFHKQVDDSSITLRYRGVDVVVDGGSYSYDREAGFGRYVESAAAHSGVFPSSIDALRRREVLSRFSGVAGAIDSFEETERGVEIRAHYALGDVFRVERTVTVLWPATVRIRDEVTTNLLGDAVAQRLLLGPELRIAAEGDRIELHHDSFTGEVRFAGRHGDPAFVRGQEQPDIRGWFSVDFGEILPTWQVERTLDAARSIAELEIRLDLA